MNTYRVTLTLSFRQHFWDEDDCSSWEEVPKERKAERKAKKEAFERTEAYYTKHSLEDYVKSFSAMGFVETLLMDEESLVAAEWDPKDFQIHLTVKTEMSEEDLLKELEWVSLEDSEYEGCGDSGWLIFTRGPNGEPYHGQYGVKDVWEYGLTDYRRNPILIVKQA